MERYADKKLQEGECNTDNNKFMKELARKIGRVSNISERYRKKRKISFHA